MELVISSMKTYVSFFFIIREILPALLCLRYFLEFQYRSVLLHVEEGQQIRADGLLPGMSIAL